MKLELFNNAIHSIYHALEEIKIAESYFDEGKEFNHENHIVHWKNNNGQISFYLKGYSKPPPVYRYKFVILNFIQGLELILKSYLHEKTETSIFKDKSGYTINLHEAIKRTLKTNQVILNDEEKRLIESSSDLRNQIQHYEFSCEVNAIRQLARNLYLLINKIVVSLFDIKLKSYFEHNHWKDDEDQIVDVIRNINLDIYNDN